MFGLSCSNDNTNMASLGKFSLLKTTALALLTLSVLVSCGPAYFPSNGKALPRSLSVSFMCCNRLFDLRGSLFVVGVTWIGCEVYTNLSLYGNDTSPIPPLPWPPAPINTTAECANLSVPLNYENPNKTITLFVKKVNALEQPSKGQLWLLQGSRSCLQQRKRGGRKGTREEERKGGRESRAEQNSERSRAGAG